MNRKYEKRLHKAYRRMIQLTEKGASKRVLVLAMERHWNALMLLCGTSNTDQA